MRSAVMVTCPNLTGKLRLFVEPTRAFRGKPEPFLRFRVRTVVGSLSQYCWLMQPAQIIARILGAGLVFITAASSVGVGCIHGVLPSPAISDSNRYESVVAARLAAPFGPPHQLTYSLTLPP
jgi:hypothetical protein